MHPDTVVTAGPPIAVGAYYIYRRFQHAQYLKLVATVATKDWDDKDWKVRIQKYDETSVENVLEGIDTQYDFFHVQVMEIVERRIVDYVVQCEGNGTLSPILSLLLDENKQVVVHLGDPETYLSLKAEATLDSEEKVVEFVKFSVPFYTSKSKLRKRLGVAEITMMEVPGVDAAYKDYRMCIELSPYKMFAGQKEVIGAIEGAGVYTSKKVKSET